MPHDAHHPIARHEAAAGRCLQNLADRFMPEDQALLAPGGGAVLCSNDLPVRAAEADRLRLHQYLAITFERLGYLLEQK
jgi:hypothetical protein